MSKKKKKYQYFNICIEEADGWREERHVRAYSILEALQKVITPKTVHVNWAHRDFEAEEMAEAFKD
jgi:hypothetical protein